MHFPIIVARLARWSIGWHDGSYYSPALIIGPWWFRVAWMEKAVA